MHRSGTLILTILVVEDDDDIRTLAAMALELDPDFRVLQADSASVALQRIREERELALILIDRSLPDMDGFQLAEAIRQISDVPAIPFAFFTASVRDSDMHRYTAAGASGIISKPFDPLTLAQTVRNLI